MKITKAKLKQIIKEELEVVLTNEEAVELFGEEIEELLNEEEIGETISKERGKYVVRPKGGGKALGTHTTEKKALKQLAAIEISKAKRGK
jgi:hypothetical protein